MSSSIGTILFVFSILLVTWGLYRLAARLQIHPLLGVAAVPTFISVIASLAYTILPPLGLAAAPPLIAVTIAYLVGPTKVKLSIGRSGTTWFAGISAIFAASLLLFGLYSYIAVGFTPHDLSIYLLQATDLLALQREGQNGLHTLLEYQHPYARQSHSILFQILLAWAFAFGGTAGYGADTLPKVMIAATMLATLIGIIALFGRNRLSWGFVAVVSALANPLWGLEASSLSRDCFYLAPAIILIALLMEPPRLESQTVTLSVVIALTAIAVVLGHSLGIVLVASIFAAHAVLSVGRDGWRGLASSSVLINALVLAASAAFALQKYMGRSASNLGFHFPYYKDPFQQEILRQQAPFRVDPPIVDLVGSVLQNNGLHWVLVAAAILLAIYISNKRAAVDKGQPMLAIFLLSVVVFQFAIVYLIPIRLEGLSLAAAYKVNARYGFAVGTLAWLGIAATLIQAIPYFLRYLPPNFRSYAVATGLVAVAALSTRGINHGYWYAQAYTEIKTIRDAACLGMIQQAPRVVFVDDLTYFYTCPNLSKIFSFSQNGAEITRLSDSKEIANALATHNIDGAIFSLAPTWWSGTRLYQFFQANWIETGNSPSRAVTFRRP